jgi:hypothetical protein
MIIDELLLMSGNDIPFPEAQLIIHNPTLKEIGLIGEETFFTGCGVLTFSRDNLTEEDRINSMSLSEIEILLMMMNNQEASSAMQKNRVSTLVVLTLLFPEYKITLANQAIVLHKDEQDFFIDKNNFHIFKEILEKMFCLKGRSSTDPGYNPGGKLAQEIADKLKQRQKILAEQQGEQKISILSRYASILAIGLQLDLNDVLQYNIFQLYDQFNRYELFEQFDIYIRAQLAGASGMKEVENWKTDIHPNL